MGTTQRRNNKELLSFVQKPFGCAFVPSRSSPAPPFLSHPSRHRLKPWKTQKKISLSSMSPLALILVHVIVAHATTKMMVYETALSGLSPWNAALLFSQTTTTSSFMYFPHHYADIVSLASPCVALLQLSPSAMHWEF